MGSRHDDIQVLGTLRGLIREDYKSLTRPQLRAVFRGMDAEGLRDLAEFWGALARIGGGVVSALPTVLPIAGTAIGGPIGGALARGALGAVPKFLPLAGAALGGPAGGALGRVGGALLGGVLPPATAAPWGSARGTASPPAGSGSPAAAQLLSLLFRPEMLQALLAMILGQSGRSTVPVGNTPVPVGAFTNLLSVLANSAGQQNDELARPERAGLPPYLLGPEGECRCDPAVPEERAELLWERLRHTPVSRSRPSLREAEGVEGDEGVYLHEWDGSESESEDLYESALDETWDAEDLS